ncbi:translation initiation factor IF-2-like [Motacilla alba alba]|uniref:translation initiation factor IF-2-like n=1 Tax=Motacilla alba alba TaxID=1094192 RepID=UPI0018D54A6F|nr:translation initiation factor IF-2-like [Motacilla alba alba]
MLPSVTLKCVGATLRSKGKSLRAAAQQRDGSEPGSARENQTRAVPGCGTREHAPCDGSRRGSPGSAGTEPEAPSQAGGLRARPGALWRNRCDRPRCRPVPSRRERGNRGGATCPALPCPALPCPALPCPALPCSRFGPAGGPGPTVRGSPVGAAKVAGTRVYDSRQDTAVRTPLHSHATRGDRAGTASALTHRCWLRAGQGCPPLPRIPAASRAPLRSGRAAAGGWPFPSAVTARARPGLRPPALPAGCAERMGWDGSGWERGGRRRPGCGSGSGCQDAVTMGTRCRPGGGSPSHRPLPAAISRQGPSPGEQGGTARAPQTAALPAARGRAAGTERGPCPRLPRRETPASRQKVRW